MLGCSRTNSPSAHDCERWAAASHTGCLPCERLHSIACCHHLPPTFPQIEEETRNLAHYTDFRVVSVVGGQSIEDQGFLLR